MEWLGEDLDALEHIAKKRRRLSNDVAPPEQKCVPDAVASANGGPSSVEWRLNEQESCSICLNAISNAAWVYPCLHRDFCLGQSLSLYRC